MAMDKKAVSLMVSYVILVSIAISLSIGVYVWLKDYTNVSPKTDCKDGTSLRLENYTILEENITLFLKNNGRFNISGFIMIVGNDSEKMPTDLLPPHGSVAVGGAPVSKGHFNFDPPLKPGETQKAVFLKASDYEIKVIQIQPYIRDKRIIVCEQAVIKENIN